MGLRSGKFVVLPLLVGVMFTPTLGTLAARLVERTGFADAGLRWGRGRYHLAAWLLPFSIGFAAMALTVVLGAGRLDLSGRVLLRELPPAVRYHMAPRTCFAVNRRTVSHLARLAKRTALPPNHDEPV